MWNFICPELLSAIKGDPENDVVGDLFHSLAKVWNFLKINLRK